MKSFKDPAGQEWNVRLDIGTVARCKEAGVDLASVYVGGEASQAMILKIATDLETIGKLLWIICKPQIDERKLDAAAFAGLFDGPTLATATEALIEEIVYFFDEFRQTTVLHAAWDKSKQASRLGNQRVLAMIEAMTPENILNGSGERFGAPPADSASSLTL